MKSPELETISIFSKDIFLNLTINQISKEIDKSYGFTNKYIRDFLDDGILSKKIVGSAILCSLNFSNEKTLGLLMLNSIEEKMNFLQKNDKKIKNTLQEIQKLPAKQTIFLSNNQFHIICEDKEKINQYLTNNPKLTSTISDQITLLDNNEFKLNFKKIDMKNLVIFEGYEQFWRLISDMMK